MQSHPNPAIGSGLSFVLLLAATVAAGGPPATEKHAVTDTYHGVSVNDDYRWLEDGDDPRVKAWSDAQNALRAIGARRAAGCRPDPIAGDRDVRQQHRLRRHHRQRRSVPRDETAAAQGAAVPGGISTARTRPSQNESCSIRWPSIPRAARRSTGTCRHPTASSSPSRSRKGGSERGDVHVYETATGKAVAEVVPGVNGGTAGGSAGVDAGRQGLLLHALPPIGRAAAPPTSTSITQVYFHTLGTPAERDRYEIGNDFPRIAEIQLDASGDGRFVLANVQNGDGGEFSQFLRMPDGRWHQLTHFADKILYAVFGHDSLYLLSRAGAPRGKILRLPLSATAAPAIASARVVVPESRRGHRLQLRWRGHDRRDDVAPVCDRPRRRAQPGPCLRSRRRAARHAADSSRFRRCGRSLPWPAMPCSTTWRRSRNRRRGSVRSGLERRQADGSGQAGHLEHLARRSSRLRGRA